MLVEVDCRGTGTDVFQVLPELAQVSYAASGPDLFAGCERLEGDAACLLQFSGCEVCVGEHHRGEEIAAHEHVIVDGLDAAARVLRGVGGTAEVAQAVTELGGKLSLVEIPDPLRIGLFIAPVEFPGRFGESMVTCLRIAEPGQGARLHGVEMRREGGGRYSAGACSGRACEVGRFAESAYIGGLVAHRVEDGGAQKTIVASLGEAEGLNEVLLGEPARPEVLLSLIHI